MAYCTRGKELLMDLKKSEWLPVYDEEGLRSTLLEVLQLIDRIHPIRERLKQLKKTGEYLPVHRN